MSNQAVLSPLETLFEAKRGRALPLTPNLTRLYGNLRMSQALSRQHVFSNFVSTLDGVVSLQARGHDGGADISGFSIQDRMVMGLLRAIADVVIVGTGTLEADPQHVWTPDGICPGLTDDFRTLRVSLRKPAAPLNVLVSGSGQIDLRLPVFTSGRVQTVVITTTTGAKRLIKRKAPPWLKIHAIPRCRDMIPPSSILDAVRLMNAGKWILIEGGPRLIGEFYARGLVDEQFLTLAPQIAGREYGDERLSLVMGQAFPPGRTRWGTLTDVRRGASHLFLRYSFRSTLHRNRRRRSQQAASVAPTPPRSRPDFVQRSSPGTAQYRPPPAMRRRSLARYRDL
jgi:riboflavin biosynthesis pyrimidine reductase